MIIETYSPEMGLTVCSKAIGKISSATTGVTDQNLSLLYPPVDIGHLKKEQQGNLIPYCKQYWLKV